MIPDPNSPSPEPSQPRPDGDVTQLLLAWRGGDTSAGERLLHVIYDELHRQASRAMRHEGTAHTLQATALVNEAYLRLIDQSRVEWKNRAHFFGVAAQAMRRVLVDHARHRHAIKRGGGEVAVSLANVGARDDGDAAAEVLALHEALDKLAAIDPDQARLVELRYFGGLSIEETAEAIGVSISTVKREWAIARAFLRREIDG